MGVLESFRLDGKSALVTGCSRGIGQAIAIALAEAGADILGVSASLPADGGETAQQVQMLGRTFHGSACDFNDRSALLAYITHVKANFPTPDILVSNAGTILRKPAAEHPDEYWDEVLANNLSAPFILTREIGRAMVARGSGKIIFIASLLTFQGGINVPGYAASKGGVGQLTKAFANEWAASGVNVNAIAPGYISTRNTEALRSDTVRSDQIMARIPAARWGDPEDIKGPITFLASDASAYVHGTVLVVDGGWLAR